MVRLFGIVRILKPPALLGLGFDVIHEFAQNAVSVEFEELLSTGVIHAFYTDRVGWCSVGELGSGFWNTADIIRHSKQMRREIPAHVVQLGHAVPHHRDDAMHGAANAVVGEADQRSEFQSMSPTFSRWHLIVE